MTSNGGWRVDDTKSPTARKQAEATALINSHNPQHGSCRTVRIGKENRFLECSSIQPSTNDPPIAIGRMKRRASKNTICDHLRNLRLL